ncbi:hypothetical protein IAD21_02120 [Abditibacteriota bacterium]|nr:hypothetical protein IAD21_02120 [Abditibacteriota bacterium]
MQLKSRIFALPLAAVLASGAFFHSAPAQAAPKSKTYKAGAIALGALGAYFLSKGKTLEGAAILGGGYLAYKKGEKERKNEKYGSNYGNDRYGSYDGRYDNNGGYNNGTYYNGNASYNSGSDYRYNDSSYDNSDYSNSYDGDDSDRECQNEGNGRGRGNGQYRSNGRSWQR